MYILAIETTGPFGSVALVSEEENINDGKKCCKVLGKRTSVDEMNHLKDLLPMAGELLAQAGIAKSQLSHIAVSAGPGSFTGIRIGVSTARALGQALNLPVISVPTLDAFLWKENGKMGKDDAAIVGILNARRGQVYGIVEDYMEGCPCMLTDVMEIVTGKLKEAKRPVIFYGDGIDAYEEKIVEALNEADMEVGRDVFFAPKEVRYQDAVSVSRLAFEKAENGEVLHYNELHPQYMRKAEAEEKLAAGQLPICKLPKQE